jgi:hypothetical protein
MRSLKLLTFIIMKIVENIFTEIHPYLLIFNYSSHSEHSAVSYDKNYFKYSTKCACRNVRLSVDTITAKYETSKASSKKCSELSMQVQVEFPYPQHYYYYYYGKSCNYKLSVFSKKDYRILQTAFLKPF